MRYRCSIIGMSFLCGLVLWTSCDSSKNQEHAYTEFSKADSLTEIYLALQDTMVQVWNTMIHDDNRKIRTMRNLVHELRVSGYEHPEELDTYETRLEELAKMRYDQTSISDPEIVSAYDFASNSLVTELVAVAESQTQFTYNSTLQKMVESIRSADLRVMNYRAEYDEIASRFNHFIENNEALLEEIHPKPFLQKRPLFQMASE
jgi:hypothetical protein